MKTLRAMGELQVRVNRAFESDEAASFDTLKHLPGL